MPRKPTPAEPWWPDAADLIRGYMWLDPQEAKDLSAEIVRLVQRATRDRDALHHPPGSRRFTFLVALAPAVEPPST